MKNTVNQPKNAISAMSSFIFVGGVFFIGLVGLALLSAIAYAMVTENLAMGIASGILLFSPYLVGIVWFLGLGYNLASEKVTLDNKELAEVMSEN